MIDFHIHSTASDGTLSPSEIILKSLEMNLSAVALTDHDTTDGLDEFLSSAENTSLEAVPGVEIAGHWNHRELHILGYWIDYRNNALERILENARKNRSARNEIVIEKLNNKGYAVTQEELTAESKGDVLGRPHIASLLVRKNYFKSVQDVFSSCLSRGSECYTPRILPEVKEVIDAIHLSGGVAIWAHPLHRNKSDIRNAKTDIISLVNLGLDGVEAYYPEYTLKQHKLLLKCAEELKLAISGGTDFHGENQPTIMLALGHGELNIPDEVYCNLKKYRESKLIIS